MTMPQPNRRLGARYPIQPLEVRWRVGEQGKPKGLFRKTAESLETRAMLADVSISGASVTAPAAPDLIVGSVVRMEALGALGDVVIRRINEDTQPDTRVYGVEFTSTYSPLAQILAQTFVSGHSAIPDWEAQQRRPML